MMRRMCLALAWVAPILACEQATETSGTRGGVALEVLAAPGAARALDSGRVHIEGPTPRVVSVTPGSTVTIEELEPGSYTVSLEGFVGDHIERFGRTSNVQVVAGQNRAVSVSFNAFRPVLDPVTLTSDGLSFTVAFQPLADSDSHRVQVDVNPDFSAPAEQTTTGTTVTFSIDAAFGPRFVRVQGFDPFDIPGVPSDPKEIAIVRLTTIPDLDGFVISNGGASPAGTSSLAGDNGSGLVVRGFYGFDLSPLDPGGVVTGAVMRIFQAVVIGDPYTALGPLIVDHLLFDPALDAADFATAPLAADIGTLSTGAELVYKSLPVTNFVLADRAATRSLSQFRIRFTTDDNGDTVVDLVGLGVAETVDPANPPELIVVTE